MSPVSRPPFALVESLETRRLLSAASVQGGILRVTGTAGAANDISVEQSADGTKINVVIDSTNARGAMKHFATALPRSVGGGGVRGILVRGGNRDDNITIDSAGVLNLPCRVFGLAGNDVIRTGGGNDRISGGDGNDDIYAGAGDDLVRGDKGDDNVYAGDGNDTVYGGPGSDALMGEAGNDVLWGGPGDDVLDGGDGDDKLVGILGNNVMNSGPGHDTFVQVLIKQNQANDFDYQQDVITYVLAKTDDGNHPPAI